MPPTAIAPTTPTRRPRPAIGILGALPPARQDRRGRQEPGRKTEKMLHRRPSPDCPLCPLWGIPWDSRDSATYNQQHIHAEKIWHAWDGGQGRHWARNVCEEALALGVTCTPEEARRHFHYHRVEQPALSGFLHREPLLYEALNLSPRAQAIIIAVYRHRVLTTDQICEIFFRASTYGAYNTARSALSKCQAELSALCARHFLYRLYPDEKISTKRDALPQMGKQTLWFLGKASLPFIEEKHPGITLWPDHYVQMAKEVSHVKIMHDLRANGIYTRLQRALRESKGLVQFQGQAPAAVELRPENWYGDKSLAIAFYNVAHRLKGEVRADGLASLSVHRNTWELDKGNGNGDKGKAESKRKASGLPSCQLPFFYEYDRASKHTVDVANQLLDFHWLAVSAQAQERFPELSAPGYAIPVIMVCSSETQLKNIHRVFRERAAEERLPTGAPIFLVSEKDWTQDPLADGICRVAWEDEESTHSFLDLILRASMPLIRTHKALASQTLTIDPKGAKRLFGVATEEGLQTQRTKKAERKDERSEAARRKEQSEQERLRREERALAIRERATQDEAKAVSTSITPPASLPTPVSVPTTAPAPATSGDVDEAAMRRRRRRRAEAS